MYKRIIILIMIFCLIFSVGIVSADDNSTDGGLAVNEDIELNDNEDTVLKSSNQSTFTDIRNLVDEAQEGDTIELSGVYEDNCKDCIGVSVSKPLTLKGDGNTVIRPNGGSFINIYSPNVSLINLKFVNIYEDGCRFTPINLQSENISIINCSFINCSANILACYGDNSRFINNTFINCTSEKGILSFYGHNIEVSSSRFIDCNSSNSTYGGVFFMGGTSCTLKDCMFANCYSLTSGGAFRWNGPKGKILNSTFINCSAASGGAIRVGNNECVLRDCSFINCYSPASAGAVAWISSNSVIENVYFENCSAHILGGALYVDGENVTVNNASFINITCLIQDIDNDLVTIFWRGTGNLSNSRFVKCTLTGRLFDLYKGQIVAIMIHPSLVNMENCSFTNCSSDKAAINLAGNVTNCIFDNCNARTQFAVFKDCTMTGSRFISCSSKEEGIAFTGGEISNSSFINCSSKNGGAVLISANTTIRDSLFVNNHASNNGGAIYGSTYGYLNIFNSIFFNNSCENNGEIIFTVARTTINNCVLLPYFGVDDKPLVYGSSSKKLDVNYNWWGRNSDVSRFVSNGPFGGFDFNNWVLMDLSNTTVGNGIEFTFDLSRYMDVDGQIHDLNGTIPEFSISASAVNGTFTQDGYRFVYSPDSQSDILTFTYFDMSQYVLLGHEPRIATNLTIDRFYINQTVCIDITLTDANGVAINDTIIVRTRNTTRYVNLLNGRGYMEFDNLESGNYTIVAQYNGNWKYLPSSDRIHRQNPFESINFTSEIDFHQMLPVTVNLKNNLTGQVSISIGGKKYLADVKRGVAEFLIENLTAGSYVATVTYHGDIEYNGMVEYLAVKVKKIDPTFNSASSIIVTDSYNFVYLRFNNDATGSVKLILNNKTYSSKYFEKGFARFNVPYMEVGEYNATFVYSGDGNYKAATSDMTFKVIQRTSRLTVFVNGQNIEYNVTQPFGQNTTLSIEINKDYVGQLGVYFHNQTILIDLNGSERYDFTFENMTPGLYNISVVYYGSAVYTSASVEGVLEIEKIESPYRFNVDYEANIHEGDDFIINIDSEAEGNATLTINGQTYTQMLQDGLATFTIHNLTSNDYIGIVTCQGNEIYRDIVRTLTVSVLKYDPLKLNSTLNVEVSDISYGENAVISVFTTQNATGFVNLLINNEIYTNEVIGGEATFNITGLDAGTYPIKVTYLGDDMYNENRTSSEFRVNKIAPTLDVIAWDANQYLSSYIIVNSSALYGTIRINNGYETRILALYDGSFKGYIISRLSGNHTIIVEYEENDNYLSTSASLTYMVHPYDSSKEDVHFNVTVSDNYYGRCAQLKVDFDKPATGNVTFTFKDERYVSPIENGTAVFGIPNIRVGVYYVNVVYFGDEDYNGNQVFYQFMADSETPEFTCNIENVTYGETAFAQIACSINDDLTVEYSLDTNYIGEANLTNGSGVISLSGFYGGKHTLTIILRGNENYSYVKQSFEFYVYKLAPSMEVNVTDIIYKENAHILVNLSDATGIVEFTLNNETYSRNIYGGCAELVIYDLPVGHHTVYIHYEGDGKYNSSNMTVSFNVNRAEPYMYISAGDSDYGQDQSIHVTLDSDATGNVTLSMQNYTSTKEIGDDLTFIISGLLPGTYTANITYSGDGNYNGCITNKTFRVQKLMPSLSTGTNGITYGQTEHITVRLNNDATGNVTVYTENANYTQELVDGYTQFDITGFAAGNHTLRVLYEGNWKYRQISSYPEIEVLKADPILDLSIRNNKGLIGPVTYGGYAVVTVTMDDDATGHVAVTVGNVTYYDGQAINTIAFNVTDLDVAEYSVELTYSGDDNYNNGSAHSYISVKKAKPLMELNVSNIKYGETARIMVLINATGDVNLTMENMTYTQTIENGVAEFCFDGLDVGTYYYNVTYLGNNHYESVSKNSKYFKVSKTFPAFEYEFVNATYGLDVVVFVRTNVTGDLKLTLGSSSYTQTVNDGVAVFNLGKLWAGNKNFKINTQGDNNFYATTTDYVSFIVEKANLTYDISYSNIPYGMDEIINVTFEDDFYIRVTVELDGYNKTVTADRMMAVFNITGLGAGRHVANITIFDCSSYNDVKTSIEFYVNGIDPVIDVRADDSVYGEAAEILVEMNVDGEVTLTIANRTYKNDTQNGLATFRVEDLDAGFYQFNVTYAANGNYNGIAVSSNLTVNKADACVSVDPVVVDYGQSAVVNVNVSADGSVVLTIDNFKYSANVTGGVASITLLVLDAGVYDFNVTYEGNGNYNAVSASSILTVNKLNASVSVNPVTVDYGQSAVVNVDVSADGSVVLAIGNESYSVNVTDGVATFTLLVLDAGVYDFNVTYEGNGNYNAVSASSILTVNKLNASVSVNPVVVDYGQSAVVNVNVSADGSVVLTIDNCNYSANVTDGAATFTLPVLDVGVYDFNITYEGNANYNGASASSTLAVNKVNASVSVNPVSVDYGQSAVVNVDVSADGSVILSIGNESYSVNVTDGVATFTLPVLDVGVYGFNVTYLGNGNYNGASASSSLTVNKVNASVSVNLVSVDYGQSAVVNVDVSADGSVILAIGNESYSVNVTDGVATFTLPMMDAGVYGFNITYGGNRNYNGASASSSLTVNKVNASVSVNPVSVDYGNSAVVNVNVGSDGNVTLFIGNNSYSANITEGVATFTLPVLDAGFYEFNVTYSGNVNYNEITVTSNLTVNKIDSAVNVGPVVIDYGNSAVVNVSVNAEGNVVLTLNNANYSSSVVGGVATFNIDGLDAGFYGFDVTYLGNVNYNRASASSNLTVKRASSTIEIDSLAFSYSQIIVVRAHVEGTGSLKLTINNRTYASDIADGIASFSIDNLNAGTYDINVIYGGDINYNGVSIKDTLTVTQASPLLEVTSSNIFRGQDLIIAIRLSCDGEVSVNGQYKVNVVNGTGSLKLSNLKAGKYTFRAEFAGNENYLNGTDEITVQVTDLSRISASNLEMYYLDGSKYVVTVYGANGKPAASTQVTFRVSGKTLKANTDSKGRAKIKVDLIPKTYKVTSGALGLSVTKTIKVKQILTLKSVKVKKSAKKLILKATLKKVNGKYLGGKKITFKFNGKSYNVKTNSKGIAKATVKKSVLKKLKVGKKVTYQATYVKNTVKKTSKVNK
jgi:hypothetical protein